MDDPFATRPDAQAHPCGPDDSGGITLREYMATHILAGMGDLGNYPANDLALIAVARADALIEELNQPRKGKT